MKFRAAVLIESKKPLVIEELETPSLTFGQVLVKVLCTGICGAQINEIDAVKGPDKFLPHLLGHEATGVIVECGPCVTTVKAGDQVVLHWRKGAGIHSPTPKYGSRLGVVNAGWVTTFNEYAVISENRVTRVPKGFDAEFGALMGCAVTTAMGVVNNDARLRIGESVAIFGAGGGVGLPLVQAAALVGSFPIIAIDIGAEKLEAARRLGATHVIDAAKADTAREVRGIVGTDGVDVAVEATGKARVIETAYDLTSARGRTILVGVPTKGQEPTLYTLPLHFDKVLKGSHGGNTEPHIDIPRYVRLFEAGRIRADGLVGKRYKGIEEINSAIAEVRQGNVSGRCIVHLASS